MLPAPAATQVEPPLALQVHVTALTPAGNVSVTVPDTAYALLLVTTIV